MTPAHRCDASRLPESGQSHNPSACLTARAIPRTVTGTRGGPMRRSVMLMSALALAVIAAPPARAAYPERPIRLIIPFPAGGAVDITARLLSVRLTELFGN